ncbi:nucleobase:cation symporter-2 family protein [Pseudonocardia pini]|uniref:nucleobase:cation symporter-2 family protein n=1 Tax=Pseudonocardia pini TaxID=2758030 RepID=UPI0015F079C8|nr:nucleobase:cation symporter-2 family protein [Pseudonocardia pini]
MTAEPTEKSEEAVRPEDERVPVGKAFFFGLQHILAMYAGVVSPPIIIASAAGLSPADQALLVTAALFVSGLGTLLQSLGVPYVGSQLPLVQGVSFAAVGTMTAVATNESIADPAARMATIFGAVIVAGVIGFVIAPLFASLVRFFPPIVTGCVITIIGISLFPVALRWIRGNEMINGQPNPNYGSGTSLLLGFITLVVTLAIARFGKGLFSRLAVMLGLVIGTIIATIMGRVNWGAVASGPIFALPQPFHFGAPQFQIGVIVSMTIVILVIMAETTADLLAVGEILGTKVDKKRIAAGLRADMGATAISPVFNGMPISAFAQNVGMVAITGIKSRFVVAAGGGILVVLGLLPVLGRVMNAIPLPVLGGAGIVLFGSVAAAGIKTLSRVEFTNSNILIVATSIGVGLIPITVPEVYLHLPEWLATIFESGISATAIFAVLLNLVFNHFSKTEEPAVPDH